jgi:ABC-2 type transport system permease protein
VASAKLVLFLAWAGLLALTLTGLTMVVGLAMGFGAPDSAAVGALLRLGAVSVLTSLLAMPCAWVATLSRGILAPVGTAVGLIVLAQLAVFTGISAWFPFAAPGVWVGLSTGVGGPAVSAWQLCAVFPTAALFAWLTLRAWRRLRL